ncbi:MAG: metal ABC transporter substrate-binding protein [Actinomycetota bacterium]
MRIILNGERWQTPFAQTTAMAVAVGALLGLAGCADDDPTAADGQLSVVTAFYPIQEAATRIGGSEVVVTDLTPPGAEPHDLELTADDLEAIATADLVLFFGGGFQPAVEDAVETAAEGTTVDVLAELTSSNAYELDADPEGELSTDPHVWLDPAGQAVMAEAVRDALAEVAPGSAEGFRTGFDVYAAELSDLEEVYAVLASCRQKLLVTGHEAFGYLARAYGLEQVGIAGVSPEAEPGPGRLAEIAQLVETEGVTTIYAEDQLPRDVVDTIAAETRARVDVLYPIESLTPDQLAAGEDYPSLMEDNLSTLVRGQDCG